jgi:peptidoglycan-associated lipoprotein
MFPYLAKDGNLYFSSNGRGGLGGLDIFKAEKTGDMTFNAPVAMEYPINSSSDDFGFVLNEPTESTKFSGYLTSNRPGGKGLDDIYSFVEPPIEIELVATVYDEKTGAPLANTNVSVKGANGDDYKITTDGNGGFTLDKTKLKLGTSYIVDVQKDQYIGTGDKFSTVGIGQSTKLVKEYFLAPIIINEVYDMPLVLYPYDKAELLVNETVNSQDSLNYLLDIMQRNPKFVVQLEAHTDARGNDDYNQNLSQRRAETCVNYLISKGVDPARIKPVGKGESDPRTLVNAEGTFPAGTKLTEAYIMKLPADQQEAAHLLNRRTIFRIVDTNYVPKK